MTKEELLCKLANLENIEPKDGHYEADILLLDYINDEEITEAFQNLERWYG